MNTTPADAGELAVTIASRTRVQGVTRVICPPFVCLAAVRDALAEADPGVAVGAQDVHHELAGAYTGDISAPMLRELADAVVAEQEIRTLITGTFRDQAELHGFLRRLRAYGLDLVELRVVPGPRGPQPEGEQR